MGERIVHQGHFRLLVKLSVKGRKNMIRFGLAAFDRSPCQSVLLQDDIFPVHFGPCF